MTRFEKFLKAYNISLKKSEIGVSSYNTFYSLKVGRVVNPRIETLWDFHKKYGRYYNYDFLRLANCFKNEMNIKKTPRIISLNTSNGNGQYHFVYFLMKLLKDNLSILLLDDSMYNITQNYLLSDVYDHTADGDAFELNPNEVKMIELFATPIINKNNKHMERKYLFKENEPEQIIRNYSHETNMKNVTRCWIGRSKSISFKDEEYANIIEKVKRSLGRLDEYDVILINAYASGRDLLPTLALVSDDLLCIEHEKSQYFFENTISQLAVVGESCHFIDFGEVDLFREVGEISFLPSYDIDSYSEFPNILDELKNHNKEAAQNNEDAFEYAHKFYDYLIDSGSNSALALTENCFDIFLERAKEHFGPWIDLTKVEGMKNQNILERVIKCDLQK